MERVFSVLITLYLLTAAFTHPLLPGSGISAGERDIRFLIGLREASITLTVVLGVLVTASRRLMPIYLFGLYGGLLLLYTAINTTLPIIFSVRSVLTVISAMILPFVVLRYPGILSAVTKTLKIIVVVYFGLILVQLATLPGFYGRTFLGPRVFAAAASPLHMAFTAGAIAIFFATREKPALIWIALCSFMALASGGRTGLLITAVALMAMTATRFRTSVATKYVGYSLLAGLLVLLAFLVSSPEISGRAGTANGPLQDGRFNAWVYALGEWSHSSLFQILFGSGIGVGSNASSTYVLDFIHTDSGFVFLILSYGLVGLIYTGALVLYFLGRSTSIYVVLAWLLTGATQLVFELHPISVILPLCVNPALLRNRHSFSPAASQPRTAKDAELCGQEVAV